MTATKLIHAFTNPGADAPPYINVGRLDDGSVRVIVRGAMYPNGSSGTEEIILSEADWRSLAWSAFAETNDREREAGRQVAFDAGDLKELERMVPPDLLNEVLTHNPLHRVYFRAGLLACREYMARFVEQGGNAVAAQSIRANWWPSLGDDPGAPRHLAFDELVDEVEGEDGRPAYPSKSIDPSVEALPVANAFLAS